MNIQPRYEFDPEQTPDLTVPMAYLAQLCLGATPEQVGAAVSLVATQVVPGAEQASVSIASRGQSIDTLGAAGELPPRADLAQMELKEGPCVEAAWEDALVHLRDTGRADRRWPRFAPRAAALGVGSMLALQLTSTPTMRTGTASGSAR